MWNVLATPAAKQQLNNLDTSVQERIQEKLGWLAENADAIDHNRLSGEYSDFYKLRVGDYRVLYQLRKEKNMVRVAKIGHRSDIYDV